MSKQPRGLGRGLAAFFPEMEEAEAHNSTEVLIENIAPNPFQPRRDFKQESLEELAQSIKAHGILQPLLVKKVDDGYQLIAGERRLRAAKIAGLSTVPVIVKDLDERLIMEITLVENLQREDLNPIEEAEGYRRLIDEFQLTQEQVAKTVGKSRSAITNTLRLLNLPPEIQACLIENKISSGHARALLAVESTEIQIAACEKIIAQNLSVRETEKLVREIEKKDVSRETLRRSMGLPVKKSTVEPEIQAVIEGLTRSLGTKVNIKKGKKGGKIEIEYYSAEELERITEILLGSGKGSW